MAQRGARGGRPVAIDDVYECDEVARDAQLEVFYQRTEEWFDALSKQLTVLAVENQPQNCHPNPHYVEEEYFDVEKEDYDIKKEDEYIERVCVVNWDSPPIYDDYLEDYSQGDKIEFDKNKVIYIRGEPITHTVDETFNIKKQKVIGFTNYNHRLVQSVCLVVDQFSIDEQSSNLLKLELEHIRHYDFIGVDELLSKFFGNTVNINLERLVDNVIDPFSEDCIEQELIEVNKRRE